MGIPWSGYDSDESEESYEYGEHAAVVSVTARIPSGVIECRASAGFAIRVMPPRLEAVQQLQRHRSRRASSFQRFGSRMLRSASRRNNRSTRRVVAHDSG